MSESPTTKKKVIKGWIGHESYLISPLGVVNGSTQIGLLFKTRKDAMLAGWQKPKRVEVTFRLL